nr:MAG TPA: hypothetical protein [Caudoviricetes sp.]
MFLLTKLRQISTHQRLSERWRHSVTTARYQKEKTRI